MKGKLYHFYQTHAIHFRETIRLSLPVTVAQLGLVMMGVIDNMMIGDVGYEYLSAASLANSVYFIISVLGIGITFAISALVAEADAAGKPLQCRNYLIQGTWVSILTAIIIAFLIGSATLLLPYLNQPESDILLATPYLHIINISIIPMLVFLSFKQFSDGMSLTRPAMIVTLLGLGFNVWVNWLLIYGHWGFPRLELIGAGYGTLASRTFMMMLMMGYVLYSPQFKNNAVRTGWLKIDWTTAKKIVGIGLPSGFQYFFEVGAFGGAVLMIGWMGMMERSAHQIAISMAAMAYMVVTGIAAGATIRVGNALGRHDYLNMRRAGMAGIYLSAVFMLLAAVAFVVGNRWFPSLYVSDEAVLEIAGGLMIIAAVFAVFDGVQAVGIGVLRGMQDVKIPTMIAFIAYWIIALPVGYFLGFTLELGIDGIWYGFVVSLVFAAVWLTGRFWRLTSQRIETSSAKSNQDLPEEVAVKVN